MQKKTQIIFSFCLLILLLYPSTHFAATNVGGPIRQNTTWTAANSPYLIIQSVKVNEGVTLTIEPGVRVEFFRETDQALDQKFNITVEGQLIAKGTKTNPIIFTSSSPNPKPGDWEFIEFTETAIGAEYSTDGKYLAGSIFEHVTVEYGGNDDEAITATGLSAPYLNYVIMQNNKKAIAIRSSWDEMQNTIFIDNSTFINNTGSFRGGAIYVQYLNVNITNCTFTNNSTPTHDGGAIFSWDSSLNITNCTFTNNSSVRDGGAIYSKDSTLTATNCTFINNICNNDGGAICSVSGGTLKVTKCTFTSNLSLRKYDYGINHVGHGGGAIYSYDTLTVTDCTFTNNSSISYTTRSNRGGAIYSYDTLTVVNSIFINNSTSANNDGGAIYGSCQKIFYTLIYNNDGKNQICGNIIDINESTIVYTGNSENDGISLSFSLSYGNSISNSNIFGHGRYDIMNNSGSDIKAINNYWGTTDEMAINLKIFDKFDDSEKREVVYYPYLTSFASNAPAIPDSIDVVGGYCVEINNSLDLIFDCVKFGVSGYQFRLNYYPLQNQTQKLIWKLDLSSFSNLPNIIGTYMELLPDFTLKVTCAEYNGTKYSFDMHLFQNPLDTQGIYFELDPATFKNL